MSFFNISPQGVGAIRQYSADDRSQPAQVQRDWWKAGRAQTDKMAQAPATPLTPSADPYKPTMESLSAIKNKDFAAVQKNLLTDFNLGREAGNRGFADYLKEANRLNAQAGQDLSRDVAALDTGDFAKRLAGIRDQQKGTLLAQRDDAIKYAAGDRERMLANSGNPTGYSSDLENRAISSFLSASLPVNQQILQQEAQDAELLQRMNMGTVGQRASLQQNYLRGLLTPEQARQSQFAGYLANVGGLQNLDANNTFYEKLVSKPYQPNTPIYNANPVYGANYVPPVRSLQPFNYGLLERKDPPDKKDPPRDEWPESERPEKWDRREQGGSRKRSAAEESYRRVYGLYPDEDPGWANNDEAQNVFRLAGGNVAGDGVPEFKWTTGTPGTWAESQTP